jgi:hypothetical protein
MLLQKGLLESSHSSVYGQSTVKIAGDARPCLIACWRFFDPSVTSFALEDSLRRAVNRFQRLQPAFSFCSRRPASKESSVSESCSTSASSRYSRRSSSSSVIGRPPRSPPGGASQDMSFVSDHCLPGVDRRVSQVLQRGGTCQISMASMRSSSRTPPSSPGSRGLSDCRPSSGNSRASSSGRSVTSLPSVSQTPTRLSQRSSSSVRLSFGI